jgi:hypothetical protein
MVRRGKRSGFSGEAVRIGTSLQIIDLSERILFKRILQKKKGVL